MSAYDDLVRSITTLPHKLMLHNLGITIHMDALAPPYSEYRIVLNACVGEGRIGRFFARRIRPWLFPRVDEALRLASEFYYRELQRAMINEVLKEGEKTIDERN